MDITQNINLILKRGITRYPSVHAYRSDRTENIQAFFFDNLADLDNHYDRNAELAKEAWPDDEARKERGKRAAKYWTGIHGDAICALVGGLTK